LGLALGWGTSEALVIAGALGISSSAIATKLLIELHRLTNAETPIILGIIVIEDLFLTFYLALLAPVLSDSDSPLELVRDIAISFGFLLMLFVVARYGARAVGWLVGSREDELLAVLVGLVVLVAGLSEEVGVSDAIGALLIGLVVSRTAVRERVERLVMPLRDVFAAVFFVVFGLSIDIGDFGRVAVPALIAVITTLVANLAAGVIGARLFGFNQRGATNMGLTILGRGEFSLILATLAIAAGLDRRIGPFVALYVLILAVREPAAGRELPAPGPPDAGLAASPRLALRPGRNDQHVVHAPRPDPDHRDRRGGLRRMCGARRRVGGASALHVLRRGGVLRRLAEPARLGACAADGSPPHRGLVGRPLAVLLSGRGPGSRTYRPGAAC
jgi:Kef-type K+ transport system membrane component KefB